MQSFLLEYVQYDARDYARFRGQIRQALESPGSMDVILGKLRDTFCEIIPADYIFLTFTFPEQESQKYFMYPWNSSFRKYKGNVKVSREIFQTVKSDPCRINVGNSSDYSIAIGYLNQLFPNSEFSIITFRYLNKNNYICAVSLINFQGRSYEELHVKALAAVADMFTRYFDSQIARFAPLGLQESGGMDDELDYLPITLLPGLRETASRVWRVARLDFPLLLLGETGTGKEVIANTVYKTSARVYGPYIPVNCGGIPDNLVDSELFGHEKGAFTGAVSMSRGCFERASRGVLFLDEIGELLPAMQTRFLRVLQEKTITRVGGREQIRVDVRIIAATHRNLAQMVRDKEFREDLYYRLNIFPIIVPPLRERPEDIPILVRFFVKRGVRRYGWPFPDITSAQEREIASYAWPGNVRELKNAVERALILWGGSPRTPFCISSQQDIARTYAPGMRKEETRLAGSDLCTLEEATRRHIEQALIMTGGKISGPGGAAELLDVLPTTLRAKMRKLGVRFKR